MCKYLIAVPRKGKARYVNQINIDDNEVILTNHKHHALGEDSLALANSLKFESTSFKVIDTPLNLK